MINIYKIVFNVIYYLLLIIIIYVELVFKIWGFCYNTK